MDNYASLLEQFHHHEQQQTVTHQVQYSYTQQYTYIIDDIRNAKQSKLSLIMRKKQQRDKFMHRTHRNQEKQTSQNQNVVLNTSGFQDDLRLEEINNNILKKQLDQIQKQVCQSRKAVNQVENQLSVFARKDNQIKQLMYSSRRQLENAQMETKNQKLLNQQQQEKHERVLEQLNAQRTNLQHQNRYLADRLNQMKSKTKNLNFLMTGMLKTGVIIQQAYSSYECAKIEQIYTKKNLQQTIRVLYILSALKKKWNSSQSKANFENEKENEQSHLKPSIYFQFCSKKQIFEYYLQFLGLESFKQVSINIVQFYRAICNNINKLQNVGNQLNFKYSELKEQCERLDKIIKSIQCDKQKCTILMINQMGNFIKQKKYLIKDNSRFIFCIIQAEYKLVDHLKRLIETLNNVIEQKNQFYGKATASNFQFHKKLESLTNKQKRISTNISSSSKNITQDNSLNSNFIVNLTKTNSSILSNKLNLTKKSSHQSSKGISGPGSHVSALSHYEQILFRNPKQIIFGWYDVIKNGVDGANLLQTILENDLYRIFFQPRDYNSRLGELENQEQCCTKVYEDVQKIIFYFKNSLQECLKNIIDGCKQIQQKNKYLIPEKSTVGETRFVIQSKGYFRRDNFKLLQKLELIQMKKKGLFVPYRYGIDVQQQMLSERKRKQLKFEVFQKNKGLSSSRLPRNTAPDAANYISSHREKLNKANRKIRDLLKNADTLRLKKRSRKDSSCTSTQNISSSFLVG